MATGFDPYHRWLSIPRAEQPPTHYRLLGLRPLESNFAVIRSATEQQINHVRLFLEKPLQSFATNLIRELELAGKCLMDAEAKAAYDAWLEQLAAAPRNFGDDDQNPSVAGRAADRGSGDISAQRVRVSP